MGINCPDVSGLSLVTHLVSKVVTWRGFHSLHRMMVCVCVCVKEGPLTLDLLLLQVAVTVCRGQTMFLQVPADAEAGPPHATLTFEPRLVQRVHHCEHALVALDAIRCRCSGGSRLSLKGTEVSAGVKGDRSESGGGGGGYLLQVRQGDAAHVRQPVLQVVPAAVGQVNPTHKGH